MLEIDRRGKLRADWRNILMLDGVYLDLKKAFDKVPHQRLLWKMKKKKYGKIGGRLLEWMEDYLDDREMRTVIQDQNSSWLKVTGGVPQGSV